MNHTRYSLDALTLCIDFPFLFNVTCNKHTQRKVHYLELASEACLLAITEGVRVSEPSGWARPLSKLLSQEHVFAGKRGKAVLETTWWDWHRHSRIWTNWCTHVAMRDTEGSHLW